MTLLNLMSVANRPKTYQDDLSGAEEEQSSEIIVVLVSLVTTCITFSFTMMGAGSALTGLKKVAARISRTGRISAGMRRSAEGALATSD